LPFEQHVVVKCASPGSIRPHTLPNFSSTTDGQDWTVRKFIAQCGYWDVRPFVSTTHAGELLPVSAFSDGMDLLIANHDAWPVGDIVYEGGVVSVVILPGSDFRARIWIAIAGVLGILIGIGLMYLSSKRLSTPSGPA